MADATATNEVTPVDVDSKQPQAPNGSHISNTSPQPNDHDENKTNNTATDENTDNGTARQPLNAHMEFTAIDAGDGEYDENEEDDDYEERSGRNINPLNHEPDDMEMETIRNSYRNSGSDLNSIDSTEDGSLSSPSSSSKRATMFQDVPLPDDFLLSATLAIRTSILAGDSKRRFLDDSDFQSTRKYKISMAGDKKSEIKDFAPVVFSHIRKKYGISMQSYLMSWSDDKLIKHKATGKSSAFFVHSPDGKYILKTIRKSEAVRLRKILMDYYQHLETYPDSLLSKIFGLHRVSRRRGLPKIYFAIFNNVFDSQNSFNEIFDLKGSTVGRRASAGEIVLKDLDLGEKKRVHLPPHVKARILEQIEADCKFLSNHELMDYSLLVGIRRASDRNPPSEFSSSKIHLDDQRLPGLLFFLESTKSVEVTNKASKKRIWRKSITRGRPIFASMDDLREGIQELDVSANTNFNMSLSHFHESPELATSPDLTSDVGSYSEKDKPTAVPPSPTATSSSTDNSPKLRKVVASESHISNLPTNRSPTLSSQSTPVLKGVLKRGASECRLVTSSSAPHLNTRKDTDGVYVNDSSFMGYTPFYQQDDGGLRSPKLQDEGNNKFYEIYHFGIIDFLQKYDKKKKLANFAKTLKYEKEAISTVDPSFYMSRFLRMAEKVIGTTETVLQ